MNPINNIPFALARAIQEIRKRTQPEHDYQDAPEYYLENTKIKDRSAQLAPYYRAPETDPKLESIKQAILNESQMTDEAKKYFSSVPIVSREISPDRLAEASDLKIEQPAVFINKSTDTNNKENMKQIIIHELLHNAPRIFPKSLTPMNKNNAKDFYESYGTDKHVIKEEQFAEQQLPKWIYSHIFKR